MSDLPRITPTPAVSVPPVRPTRHPDQKARKRPARDPKPKRRDDEADPDTLDEVLDEDIEASKDSPKGTRLSLRV